MTPVGESVSTSATDSDQATERSYLMLLIGDERRTSDAALGIALRASGHNLRVHIIEFLKAGRDRGEVAAVQFLAGVTLAQFGLVNAEQTTEDVDGPPVEPERLEAAIRDAEVHIQQRVTNLLIFDGLLTAVDQGLVSEERVLEIVGKAAPTLDIIMTGVNAPDGLRDAADNVTTMETAQSSERHANTLRRGIHY